ncbi:extracellular solute-binding protein [Muricomes intestini]|uniref:DNA-binding LacI/PurR family transcriptional regulator n=1 Tax=Muricomes intestini TaxID=1796634 RepID=A0A4R3K345_9FIRM|nr:extracellular solute-binding protein [Muricomes intestini]TCS77125.1 DNA-binding LacI/PurR family transcriptional regulator [Muricomes intestini]HCR82158.1 hypothetical protein [Lachnospiraceae bacterium]
MVTIKDVAKLAGVSHGTVSNVINGTKQVSLEKIKKVEAAMQELGYNPNANARDLKKTNSMQIDLILPNILSGDFSRIYATVFDLAYNKGYMVNLYVTNEDADLETKLLERSLMFKKDGVLLITCQPNNTELFQKLIKDGLKIVFVKRLVKGLENYGITIDVRTVVREVIESYILQKKEQNAVILGPMEYSYEEQCYRGYVDACSHTKTRVQDRLIISTNFDKESAFKEAVKVLSYKEKVDTILVSNTMFEEAVAQAMVTMDIPEDECPEVIVLTSLSWTGKRKNNFLYVGMPFGRIAQCAFFSLFKQMKNEEDNEPRVIKVKSNYKEQLWKNEKIKCNAYGEKKTLNVLLTADAISNNLSNFTPQFEKVWNCKVNIVIKDYFDMYTTIQEQGAQFDIIGLDIPWLPEFAQQGKIICLDNMFEGLEDIGKGYPKEVFEKFCKWDKHIYGLPLTCSSQLLFYRKDFFDDIRVKRLFYQQHKRELTVPRNWEEFNEVARFFTRRYNKSSPTQYGTTLGAKKYSGAVCEYLPRFWGGGGEIFENGKFALAGEAAHRAMYNYLESFQYANPDAAEYWWEEQSREFRKGQSAMMIMFGDNAATVTERTKSEIIGKIGFDFLPGRKSVAGGWTVSITEYSNNKKLAFEFLKWLSDEERAKTNTVMGGFVPHNSVLEDLEIAHVYPWLHKTMLASSYSKDRKMPQKKDGSYFNEGLFEEIVGGAVHDVIIGRLSVEEALSIANAQLNKELNL